MAVTVMATDRVLILAIVYGSAGTQQQAFTTLTQWMTAEIFSLCRAEFV